MDGSFDDVYARHGRGVRAYLARLTGDAWTAEELCQETFLRYVAHERELVASNGGVRGWLFRVATNLAIDRMRRRRARPLRGEPASPPAADGTASRDLARHVRTVLEEVPADSKGVFLLRAHHGLPYRDVAAAFGISERAAKDRFRKVRERLSRRLAHLCEEDDG